MSGKLIVIYDTTKGFFPNGVTGKKCTAFFIARGVMTPIEKGLGEK